METAGKQANADNPCARGSFSMRRMTRASGILAHAFKPPYAEHAWILSLQPDHCGGARQVHTPVMSGFSAVMTPRRAIR